MATSAEWHEDYDKMIDASRNFSRAIKSVQEFRPAAILLDIVLRDSLNGWAILTVVDGVVVHRAEAPVRTRGSLEGFWDSGGD